MFENEAYGILVIWIGVTIFSLAWGYYHYKIFKE